MSSYINDLGDLIEESKRGEDNLRRQLIRWEQHPHELRFMALVACARDHGVSKELFEALQRDLKPDQLTERLMRGVTPEQVDAASRVIATSVQFEAELARMFQLQHGLIRARLRGESADVLAALERELADASANETLVNEMAETAAKEFGRLTLMGSSPDSGE